MGPGRRARASVQEAAELNRSARRAANRLASTQRVRKGLLEDFEIVPDREPPETVTSDDANQTSLYAAMDAMLAGIADGTFTGEDEAAAAAQAPPEPQEVLAPRPVRREPEFYERGGNEEALLTEHDMEDVEEWNFGEDASMDPAAQYAELDALLAEPPAEPTSEPSQPREDLTQPPVPQLAPRPVVNEVAARLLASDESDRSPPRRRRTRRTRRKSNVAVPAPALAPPPISPPQEPPVQLMARPQRPEAAAPKKAKKRRPRFDPAAMELTEEEQAAVNSLLQQRSLARDLLASQADVLVQVEAVQNTGLVVHAKSGLTGWLPVGKLPEWRLRDKTWLPDKVRAGLRSSVRLFAGIRIIHVL